MTISINPSRPRRHILIPSSTSSLSELAGGEPGRRWQGPNSSAEPPLHKEDRARPTMAWPEAETTGQRATDLAPLWPDLAPSPADLASAVGDAAASGTREDGEAA
uniref:Uncharacterized protein n=1 Tax=Oryza nivara TaxID=4536 RepID=A0A0E0H0M6_ORYNI